MNHFRSIIGQNGNRWRGRGTVSRVRVVGRLFVLWGVILSATLGELQAAQPARRAPPPPLRWEVALSDYTRSGKTAHVLKLLHNLQAFFRAQGQQNSDAFADVAMRLAIFQREMGDYEGAGKTAEEGAKVAARLHGANSRKHFEFLAFKTMLLGRQKRYVEAETFGKEVVRRAEAAFGPNDPAIASALEALNLARLELKKFEGIEGELRRAIEIRRKAFGEGALGTGHSWTNLGTYFLEVGKIQDASAALARGAKIVRTAEAGNVVQTRMVARNLARLAFDLKDPKAILSTSNQVFLEELKLINEVLPGMGENERLGLMARLEPIRWYATMGDAERIATAVLQTKAITLDQLLVIEPAGTGPDEFADLLSPETVGQGMAVYVAQPRTPKETTATTTTTQAIQTHKRYAITPAQIGRILTRGTVVVEMVCYPHYVGRFKDEVRYGALIFRAQGAVGAEAGDAVTWVPLGAAEPIDREIRALDADIRNLLASATISTRLRTLHRLVWEPVAAALPTDAENIFICPDGPTCFLPFGALLDAEGRFLADKQLVMYLSTVRDLFRLGDEKPAANQEFKVFAAPTYGQNPGTGTEPELRFRDVDARALAALRLPDLPGSRREAEMLKGIADGRQFQASLFLGDAANKANVFALQQPRVVHFATHGFFLPASTGGGPSNPMDRSGLALAGAQVTLKAMAEGRLPPGAAHDGLLTARDVARLPLKGTWIATLSACDTGKGESRDGEGVLGLRRGFLAAGVQNLVLSLWPVSDIETGPFMRDFYARALTSSDPATALALTQREWLGRVRKERGIAAAVSTAGAFVLNTSGRVPLPATERRE